MTDAMATRRYAYDRMLVALLFFVACPVMIGFPMGWYQAGLGRFMPVAASCGLWLSQWLISWWLSEALLQSGKSVLKPWELSFPVLLVIAAFGNILLSRYYGPALNLLFLDLSGVEDKSIMGTNRSLLDIGYVAQLFRASAYGAVYWCGLRYAYERYSMRESRAWASTPAISIAQPAAALPAAGVPYSPRIAGEFRKGGIADPDRIVALQAEDHYVRVHCDDGSSRLIYFRFADALSELKGADGIQVHRSFWVKRPAIIESMSERGNMRLSLTGGLVVPVSHKHQALLGFMLGQ